MALAAGAALSPAIASAQAPAPASPNAACAKTDFETVVEEAAGALRDLNHKNKPTFQEQLRALKEKRGWTHDQFMTEGAQFVRDEKIAVYDQSTDDLLSAISTLGQEGASAKTLDCALLLELRARMKLLVETQTAKWTYMFAKISAELAR
ncbi:MAG: hypothetical protein ACKVP4_11035 [Hyphomicrobium sp.]